MMVWVAGPGTPGRKVSERMLVGVRQMKVREYKLQGVPRGTSHGYRLMVVLLVIFHPAIAAEAGGEVFVVFFLL